MSSPSQQHPGPTSLEQTGQCLRHPRPGRRQQPHQHWHRGRSSGGSGSLLVCVSSHLISLTRPTTLRTSMSVQLFHHQSAPTTKTDTLVPCVPSPGKRPYSRATYDSAITVKATVTSTLSLGLRHRSLWNAAAQPRHQAPHQSRPHLHIPSCTVLLKLACA